MARLFFTNLNFEQQLSGDRQTLPVELEQRAAELVAGWLAVARPGDAVWCPLKISAEFWQRMADRGLPPLLAGSEIRDLPDGLELVPWGWTEPVRRFARTVHSSCEAPLQQAVGPVDNDVGKSLDGRLQASGGAVPGRGAQQ